MLTVDTVGANTMLELRQTSVYYCVKDRARVYIPKKRRAGPLKKNRLLSKQYRQYTLMRSAGHSIVS